MPPTDPPVPDIKDIVIPDPLPDYWPLVIGLGIGLVIVALVAAGGFFLYRYLRSREEKADPRQVALRCLQVIRMKGGQLSSNEFSLRVSEALKDYLSEQYGDPLRYETSEEFLLRMSEAPAASVPVSIQKKLVEFVRISDEVKFGLPPDAEHKKAPLLAQAQEIISFSSPQDSENR